MTLSVHETLKAMRELLSAPERWCQGDYAKDSLGEPCDPESNRAVCWCLSGAASKVTKREYIRGLWSEFAWPDSIPNFNDHHTHAEVLAKLDDAIKATAP